MSLWKIAWRSIGQRALASTLTGVSMTLGVSLVVVVLVVYSVLSAHFMQGAQGYHLVVGAKGSKQQLVFNTVYHLDQPIENIPYSYYKEFTEGKFASATKVAVPYCLGDSYHAAGQTFRVVGTSPDLFDKIEHGRNRDGTPKRYHMQPGGRNFKTEHFFEAVIGSVVAHQTGLKVGDEFRPAHGIVEAGEDAHQHDAFTIVGVLQPTGTPNDRAMFVNIEGFYLLEDHAKPAPNHQGVDHPPSLHSEDADPLAHHAETEDHDTSHNSADNQTQHHNEHNGHTESDHEQHDHEQHDHDHADHDHADHDHAEHDHAEHDHAGHHHHEPLPENQREVTAILVLVHNDAFSQGIYTMVNEGQFAQAVFPTSQINKFLDTFLGPVQTILLVLTVLIVLVAGVSVLVSIYNSMSDRRHEIAVMRALGAGRSTVMAIILLESILLALASGVAGLVLGHLVMGLVSPYVVERTGVSIGFLQYDLKELIMIPGLILLATIVGFLPAMAAYRTDVAKSLTASP